MKKYFTCVRKVPISETKDFADSLTEHFAERRNRAQLLDKSSSIVACFEVDKRHKNGNEYHFIYSDATVLIYNKNSRKLITILFARPGQIRRYYSKPGMQPPPYLLHAALRNVQTEKNYI